MVGRVAVVVGKLTNEEPAFYTVLSYGLLD